MNERTLEREEHKFINGPNYNYHRFKNSLEYFRAHPEYHELGRGALSLENSGLYRTLLRHELLPLAILEEAKTGRKQPTSEEIEEIIQLHHKCNGNASRAARRVKYSFSTIIRYWRKNGLEIAAKGSH